MRFLAAASRLVALGVVVAATVADAFVVTTPLPARPLGPLHSTATPPFSESVVVTRLPQSAVEVHIPVPGAATQAAYDKVAKELAKTITVPGFRKGAKIPPNVLEQVLAQRAAGSGGKNALKVQAIQELVGQLVEPTLQRESLAPIGQATLVTGAEALAETFEPGQPLALDVRCDVWPDIQWKPATDGGDKPYVGLRAKYTRKPFNQQRLDRALSDLKERYATLEPIADAGHALALGDACVVRMDGYFRTADGAKGEPLPSAAASGDRVEVVLGPGRYMEGLVEGLIGAKVGDTVTIQVSFPEKLRDKTLAGKPAIFDVEVLEASRRTVPEITDEFANKVREGLTAESLMAELRKAIDNEDAKEFVPARNKALGAALAQVFDVEVPDTLITNQARERFAIMMADMRANGVDDDVIKNQINPENFNNYKDIIKADIERDFRISMATDEIARLENINVPAYQVEEQMESIRKDAAQEKEEFDEEMIRKKVENTIQRQAVMEWLAERAELEVEYKDEEFDETLMQKIAEDSLAREKDMMKADVQLETLAEGKTDVEFETTAAEPPTATREPEIIIVNSPSSPEATRSNVVEDEEARQARYASMSLEERAYQVLKDIGNLDCPS